MNRRHPPLFYKRVLLAGLLISAATTPGALAQTTETYEYDALGRLVQVDESASADTAQYAYDAAGNRTTVTLTAAGDPVFSIASASANEGGAVSLTVTRGGNPGIAVNVDYASSNSSAVAGSDYTAVSGTLNFLANQTSKNISVATTQDSVYESNETFTITLSNASAPATIGTGVATGTINNDDTAPAFSVNNVSVSEGGTLSFTVSKTGSTALSHNINYATANGTAIAGSDYTAKSGTLTFTSAQTSKTVTVTTIEDTAVEPDETVQLNLSAATSGATISDSQGIGTINNDDVGNTPPVANDDSASGSQDVNLVLLPLANDTDADNDTLSIQSFTLGAGLTLIGSTSTSITVKSPLSGNRTLTYVASDGNGGTDSATVSMYFAQTCGTRLC
jgi:YD repeat-containing protein